jgi:hypothetical protein
MVCAHVMSPVPAVFLFGNTRLFFERNTDSHYTLGSVFVCQCDADSYCGHSTVHAHVQHGVALSFFITTTVLFMFVRHGVVLCFLVVTLGACGPRRLHHGGGEEAPALHDRDA